MLTLLNGSIPEMSKPPTVNIREKWVDDVKVIACILVVLGHFFQSMTKANILPENSLYRWFNTTIYCFHVPLFFICSGYLYQRYSNINSVDSWYKNVRKKALVLGVPYTIFTSITWILKTLFSSNINNQIGDFGDILFLHPIAPYWYLYALFFIFIITSTFSSVRMVVAELFVALVAKLLVLTREYDIYAISTVFSNEIWFVLGMSICVFNMKIDKRKLLGIISGLLFMILSVAVYMMNIHNAVISFALGLLACVAIILMVASYGKLFGSGTAFFVRYTMPIFLMHTLFAASMRSILLEVGIKNAVVHVVLGLCVSFCGPIAAACVMKKTKWLEFILYPNKVNSIAPNSQVSEASKD